MSDIVSQVNNNLQVKEEIYGRLAKLPKEIADNIVSSKTSGGRCLNAILYGCPDLSPPQTLILIVLGSKMDFRGTFQDEYQFCSLNKIADATKLSQRAVVNNLNELVKLGYVNKKVATISEQQIGHANHYCLTGKVFDSYLSAQIEKEEEKQFCATFGKKFRPVKMCKSPSDIANTPSAPDSDPLCTRFTPPSAPRADKFPSSSPTIPNVCEERPPHTHTSKSSSKTERPVASQLSGMLADFVKRYTKEKYIPFSVSQKNVDSILSKFPTLQPEAFFDEFVAFESSSSLPKLIDLNNVNLARLESAFTKLLAQKYGLEEKRTLTDNIAPSLQFDPLAENRKRNIEKLRALGLEIDEKEFVIHG